ncbi:DarT ssDNA thymidine ADP-ribosyltransferase family protein [Brevundimonas vesicularis]|uniref:DarT ssDNA thymidine ADP-ribosyltransferase family protein n=1 Tax=Brevundimonas vesicularis TaxID=41276 RepID=UPI0038508487
MQSEITGAQSKREAVLSLVDFTNFMGTKGALHACFYHFTDDRNLPSIREHGLLSMARLRQSGVIVAAPGGNEWSSEADRRSGMDQYVHLSFLDSHPMEYLAKQEGRIIQSKLLKIRPDIIHMDGVRVSLEVSNKAGVVIKPAADALDDIDLEVIYTRTNWKDEAIQKRLKAARLREILVPDHVPVEYIMNIG